MIVKPPLISVIIPIYNVEKYLKSSVDSVLNQSFKNYELILVDDGSPDGCPAICDEYAAANEFVKVIHKENGGLSDARNAGISAAVGQYLLFLDSDDFIADASFEKISQTIKYIGEVDILFLNAFCLYPDGKVTCFGTGFTKEIFRNRNKEDILEYLAKGQQFHVSACLKLVRRDLIFKNEIMFTKGILCEDVDWSIKLYLHADHFDCCEHPHYYYRQQREGSILWKFSEKKFSDIIFIILKWLNLSVGAYKEFEDIICLFMYHHYYDLVLMYGNKENKNRSIYKNTLDELSWLLNITKTKKSFFIKIFYKLFGLRLLSITLNYYLKMEKRYEK